ncbi:hypothetical protein B0I35DRAFT_422871 [Stachybotrys elegans]|uniref:Uncharacterized protein n=1 Tax=Stachybotrys elegans TaxID=80388 RepID=A0A8K0WWG8_9HYPO|nr:hypothetical protein B0I35DRAFT_422871 [Stachybotrys elegans]
MEPCPCVRYGTSRPAVLLLLQYPSLQHHEWYRTPTRVDTFVCLYFSPLANTLTPQARE